jgi:sterol O-acyltransferase
MKMHSYAFYSGHLSETERRLEALDHPEGKSTASAYHYPTSRTHVREGEITEAEKEDDDEEEENTVASLREDLAKELTSPLGRVTYPQNLTLANYVDYILCPTLCYELEYPRTTQVRLLEVFAKSLAVFGCIFLLTVISEEYITPVIIEASFRLQSVDSLIEMSLIIAESISMMLFPFMITFLLVFLVIFEYILGAFAEITRK